MVTDKELLTFCNLANLEMEYANLTYEQTVKSGGKTKTEKRNHTIYSLLFQGRNESNIGDLDIDFDDIDENKDRDYIINLFNIFNAKRKKIMEELEQKKINKQKKEFKSNIKKYSILSLTTPVSSSTSSAFKIAFDGARLKYNEHQFKKNKSPQTMYEKGKEIIRSAPIVFDYFDNPKLNGFLKEWEIVYAENLQGITIDYIYHLYNLISKKNLTKEEFLSKTELDKKIVEAKNEMTGEEIPIEFSLDFKKSLLIGQCDYLLNHICYLEIFFNMMEDLKLDSDKLGIFKTKEKILEVLKINIKNCEKEEDLYKYDLIIKENSDFFSKIQSDVEKIISVSTAAGNDMSDYQAHENNRIKSITEEEHLSSLLENSSGEVSKETLLETISESKKKNLGRLEEINKIKEKNSKIKKLNSFNASTKRGGILKNGNMSNENGLSREEFGKLVTEEKVIEKVNNSLDKVAANIKKTGIVGKILGIPGVKTILKFLDKGTKVFAWYSFFKELFAGLDRIKNLYIEPKITIESLKISKSDLRMIILKKQEKYIVVFNNFKDKELEKVIATGVINQTMALISCALNNFFLEGEYSEETTSLEVGIKNLNEKLDKKDITFIGFCKGGDLSQVFSYLYGKKNKTLVEDSSNIVNIKNLINIDEQDLEMINNQHETVEILIKEFFEITISSVIGDKFAIASTIIITAVTLLLKGTLMAIIGAIAFYCIFPVVAAKVITFILKAADLKDKLDFLKKENFIEEINGIYLATEKINKNLMNTEDESLGFVVKLIEKFFKVGEVVKDEGIATIHYKLNIAYNVEGEVDYERVNIQKITRCDGMDIDGAKEFIKSERDLKRKLILKMKDSYSKALGIYNLLKYYYLLREKNLIVENGEIKRKQNTEIIYLEYLDLTDYSNPSMYYHTHGTQYKPIIKREKRLGEILKMSEYIEYSSQCAIFYSADKNKATGLESGEIYSKKDKERIENAKTEEERNELIDQTKIDISKIDVANVFDDEYRFFPFLNGDNLTNEINNNYAKSALNAKVEGVQIRQSVNVDAIQHRMPEFNNEHMIKNDINNYPKFESQLIAKNKGD